MKLILLDVEKYIYIAGLPMERFPEEPKDFSKPVKKEFCKWCEKYMWLSKKQTDFLEGRKNSKKICMLCLYYLADYQGIEVEIMKIRFFTLIKKKKENNSEKKKT